VHAVPPFPFGDVPYKLAQWGAVIENPEAGQGVHAVPPFPFGDVPYKLAQQEKKWGSPID